VGTRAARSCPAGVSHRFHALALPRTGICHHGPSRYVHFLKVWNGTMQEFLSRILFLIGTFIALALIFFP
jgi:hypothetical protein